MDEDHVDVRGEPPCFAVDPKLRGDHQELRWAPFPSEQLQEVELYRHDGVYPAVGFGIAPADTLLPREALVSQHVSFESHFHELMGRRFMRRGLGADGSKLPLVLRLRWTDREKRTVPPPP